MTFAVRSIDWIADVCMQATSLLSTVNTHYRNYCKEPRCPKRFPSFLVSCIVCLAYSTLHFIDRTRTESKKWRHLFDQRTDLGWTTRPSAKDRVFIVMLRGDWGEGTRKRSGIDGKGSLARSCHHTLRMSSVLPTVPLLFFFFRDDGLVSLIAWKISSRVCWYTGITILGSH